MYRTHCCIQLNIILKHILSPRIQSSLSHGVNLSLGKSLLTGIIFLIGKGVVLLRDMEHKVQCVSVQNHVNKISSSGCW